MPLACFFGEVSDEFGAAGLFVREQLLLFAEVAGLAGGVLSAAAWFASSDSAAGKSPEPCRMTIRGAGSERAVRERQLTPELGV